MARRRKGDDKELVERIQFFVDRGINSEGGDVTNLRQTMFSRYYGEEFGNERDGYSKYVSREVLENVEWCLPSIMRVFLGGTRAVEFAASGSEDEDQARHETDVVNYWFHNGSEEDSGFLTLYSWVKDILMYPNGYVKISVREWTETETQRFVRANDAQYQFAQAQPNGDVVVEKEHPDGTRDIAVSHEKERRRAVVEPLPPDEVIIQHGYTKLNLDGAGFVCHRVQRTMSWLREEGFTEADLEDLGPTDSETWNDERVVRLFYTDENPDDADETFDDEADRTVWVHECYLRFDDDGDGIAERRRVLMAGTKVLENEPDDYVPIVAASAILMPHKHIGLSYAEIVSDLQELISTLTRQMLDNIYRQNVRRKYLAEQAITSDNATMDQILDGRSEVVLVRGNPAEAVMPEQVQSLVAEIGAVITEFRKLPEMRTGVAPTLTLDPSVLEKSTMGAFLGALEQASQRLELLTRLFAETGLKTVFQKIHYLLRTYFTEPQQVKIAGQWVSADPSKWKARSNISVNVGLGFNNKQVMIGLLVQLLGIQKEALQIGLVNPKKLYATLERLIEQANLGHAGTYFIDPDTPEYQGPPKPQPTAQDQLAMAQAQSLAQDSKRRDVEAKGKLDDMVAKRKAETEQAQLDADFKAAEAMDRLDESERKNKDLKSQIALRDAQIQELNARALKEGIAPVDSTAADEFARAGQELADTEDGEMNGEAQMPDQSAQFEDLRQSLLTDVQKMLADHTQEIKAAVNANAMAPRTVKYDDEGKPIGVEIG